MGVQESKATRCTQADIKKWFLNYVDTHASHRITPQHLRAFAWEYKLEHKCPELDEDQVFIILFEYYVELIVSGKINLKRNNEDNINDLAAVARAIKEEQHLIHNIHFSYNEPYAYVFIIITNKCQGLSPPATAAPSMPAPRTTCLYVRK